jgi:hypothetical protein
LQTFLPHPGFAASAQVLDDKRLNKQGLECKQILNVLLAPPDTKIGWANHPAVLMWRRHELQLCLYAIEMRKEWIRRGKNDTMLPWFEELRERLILEGRSASLPEWWGREDVHASHRARLKQKDPEHYAQFGWVEEPCGPEGYVWPVRKVPTRGQRPAPA